MHKDFYGWQDGNVDTKYSIEYIDDPETWEKFLKANEGKYSCEPWELFQKKEYDNISEAINFFIVKATHKDTYIIHMMESVYYNGKLILENPVEISGSLYFKLGRNINDDMLQRMKASEKENARLRGTLNQYENFVKKYHAEKQFQEFCDQNNFSV